MRASYEEIDRLVEESGTEHGIPYDLSGKIQEVNFQINSADSWEELRIKESLALYVVE